MSDGETHDSLKEYRSAPSAYAKFAKRETMGANIALHDLRIDVGTLSIGDVLADIDARRRPTSSSSTGCIPPRGTPLYRLSDPIRKKIRRFLLPKHYPTANPVRRRDSETITSLMDLLQICNPLNP